MLTRWKCYSDRTDFEIADLFGGDGRRGASETHREISLGERWSSSSRVHAPSPRAGVRIVLHMYVYTYRRAERYHRTCRLPAPISFRGKIDALAFRASVICARVAWAPIRSLSTNCFEEEQNKYRGAPGNDRYDRHKDKRSDVERCARKGLKGITGFELHGRRKSSSDCSSNQGLDFFSREMSFVKKNVNRWK